MTNIWLKWLVVDSATDAVADEVRLLVLYNQPLECLRQLFLRQVAGLPMRDVPLALGLSARVRRVPRLREEPRHAVLSEQVLRIRSAPAFDDLLAMIVMSALPRLWSGAKSRQRRPLCSPTHLLALMASPFGPTGRVRQRPARVL